MVMQQHSWLRPYATSQKVVGSSPDELDFFFNLPNPSSPVTKKLHLLPYKIRQADATEEVNYERTYFVIGFCRCSYHKTYIIFLMKTGYT
jgi:hypothetical protein